MSMINDIIKSAVNNVKIAKKNLTKKNGERENNKTENLHIIHKMKWQQK